MIQSSFFFFNLSFITKHNIEKHGIRFFIESIKFISKIRFDISENEFEGGKKPNLKLSRNLAKVNHVSGLTIG